MKKLLAVAVVATLTLTACHTAPVEGTVIEKEVEVSVKRKKTQICNELTVRPASGADVEVCVSRANYDRYNVGDKYP